MVWKNDNPGQNCSYTDMQYSDNGGRKKKKKTKTQSITDYKAETKQTNIWVALRLVLVFLLSFQN